MALVEGTEQLEGDPFLLDTVQKRSRTDAVVQTVLDVHPAQEGRFVRQLPNGKLMDVDLNNLMEG